MVLDGAVYLDETFSPVKKRVAVTKDREKLRGISRNNICVAVAKGGRDYYGKPRRKISVLS